MSYKEKIQSLKNNLLEIAKVKKQLPTTQNNTNLANLDMDLDLLLKEDSSLVNIPVEYMKEAIRLIIILDISGSMKGTEEDIYVGIKDLIAHHKNENILFNLIVFNGERKVLLDDVSIGNANMPKIMVGGSTNLNGSLYYTIKNKCYEGVNLVVALSDGEDNVDEIKANKVKELMKELNNGFNHFYFLGEPDETQTPEEVYASACQLGFGEDNISIFTRAENGNRLNFMVVSKMLDDLLKYGNISKTWSEPIKEHYLALTDKRR